MSSPPLEASTCMPNGVLILHIPEQTLHSTSGGPALPTLPISASHRDTLHVGPTTTEEASSLPVPLPLPPTPRPHPCPLP